MAEKKKELELKRVVMVKAIVTEAFKQNLVKELERAVKNLEMQAEKIEEQSKSYFETLKQKGMMQRASSFKQQLEDERSRQVAAKSDLMLKIEDANKLQIDTEFVQGPLEGPVNVAIGDNLYKKIGGAEIIVKDGVIQEIRGV
ncbi:MAG: YlqD family protein [Candidatus Margulisbacteria bacterium]|nr:YlqD family protein [Candidatus Margulisiibacteriota bacterium]MBU1021750.1 YlqD family protein [Candidatus Margulisiibacteriota bacterium]MBU1729496.1 YlqD family protein [Candidatus Margulisiibacteriota bacterium]MBU1955403.1 YlqD family protein [Candidatus Margulisiibacteriota bacterium]